MLTSKVFWVAPLFIVTMAALVMATKVPFPYGFFWVIIAVVAATLAILIIVHRFARRGLNEPNSGAPEGGVDHPPHTLRAPGSYLPETDRRDKKFSH